jgi:hypothetical protein
MPQTLDLSIDTFSTSLKVFATGGYDRVLTQTGDVEYSLFGAAIEDGTLYEAKHVWTIAAYVLLDDWQIIKAIFDRAERKRRTQQSYGITIADYVNLFVEDVSPRTRAIATGGTVQTISGGGVAYPALFKARMFEPKLERTNSAYQLARFILKELDRVPA